MRRRIAPEEWPSVLGLYVALKDLGIRAAVAGCAAAYGCSRDPVDDVLHVLGERRRERAQRRAHEDRIIALYNSSTSAAETARQLDIPYHEVDRVLKRRKVPRHDQRVRISAATFNLARELSRARRPLGEIAQRTGVSKTLLRKALTSAGEQVIGARHRLDHHYFDRIDSHPKAYFMGLIAADGCVFKRNGRPGGIQIGLQVQDAHILEELIQALGGTQVVRFLPAKKGHYANSKGRAFVKIDSPALGRALAQKGIGPAKSLTLRWPKGLPAEFERSFILGYFDGDGLQRHWKPSKSRVREASIGFIGTKPFLLALKRRIQRHPWAGNPSIQPDRSMFTLSFGGRRQAAAFYRWLYTDPPHALRRRYRRAQEWLATSSPDADPPRKPEGPKIPQATFDARVRDIKSGRYSTYEEMGKAWGISKSGAQHFCRLARWKPPPQISEEEHQRRRAAYETTDSDSAAARACGLRSQVFRAWRISQDLPLKRPETPFYMTKKPDAKVLRAYRSTNSDVAFGRALGLSPRQARDIRLRYEWPPKTPRGRPRGSRDSQPRRSSKPPHSGE